MRLVLEQPAAESDFMSEGWSKSVRLNGPHQSSKERLKYGFVDFETYIECSATRAVEVDNKRV